MKIRLPRTFALLALCSVLVYAQQQATAQKVASRKTRAKSVNATPQTSKEEAKKLAEAASQSRANLLSASNAYRESLEKLLELQREDELRAAVMVRKRKELLAMGKIDKRELEDGERALAEAQGKIAETIKRLAEVDQLVAEVNAAEELAKTSVERPGSYRSAELKAAASIYGQMADRIKVYIKIESEKNQYKIASSLRNRLKPYKKHFLFVFPGAQVENDPDITFTVKEYAADPRWVEVSINVNGVNGGAGLFHLETGSQGLANHILMFSYLKARSLEVGEDQAREEFQSALQEEFEKAERLRKQKNGANGANAIRTRTVKKP